MGLLDNVFGGKKGGKGNLVDAVMGMRQQGIPDAVIAQQMQAGGVPLPQIQDAMTQADIKMRVSGGGGPPQQQMGPPGGPDMGQMQQQMGPPMGQDMGQMQQQQQQMGISPMGMPPLPEQQQGPSPEEIIERIVEEKWHAMQDKFDKFEESKSELLRQMQDLRDNLNDLRVKYAQLQEDSIVKIEEYNKELEGVGSQIKAMQRVMQNMIPVFAENVRQLNDIVADMKGGNAPEQPRPPAPPQQQQQQQQAQMRAAMPSGGDFRPQMTTMAPSPYAMPRQAPRQPAPQRQQQPQAPEEDEPEGEPLFR